LAVVSVCQWFKILYFFRAFESMGPLVSMIFGILFDVRYFFLILGIILFGSGVLAHLLQCATQRADKPTATGCTTYEESEVVVAEVPSDEIGSDGVMIMGYHTWYASVLQVRKEHLR
jgi:hypothetical protein